MSRGIISLIWGDKKNLPIKRLENSIKKYHPEIPYKVFEIDVSMNISSLNQKSKMFDLSPFDETLYLDCDTVIMSKLDFGFNKAREHNLAICIAPSPWARRYKNIFQEDEIEYNTGVIFFTKKSKSIFEKWKEYTKKTDTSSQFIKKDGKPELSSVNDQGSFALAISREKFNPYVLPLNWNFRPQWNRSFFGPIKIWHDYRDPPSYLEKLNAYYSTEDHIIQYHEVN